MKRFLVAVSIIALLILLFVGRNDAQQISYSEATELISSETISKVELYVNSNQLNLTGKDSELYTTIIPSVDNFTEFMEQEGEKGNQIEYDVIQGSDFLGLLISLLPLFLMIYFFRSLATKMTGEENQKIEEANSKTTFKDIAGLDEEIEEVKVIIDFLKNPKKFRDAGAKIPKGILFHGAPGTGKTLLAKAIAGEAGVPFFSVTASSFEEKYVGVGAARIRRLFEKARKVAPSIIFIDEIDSLLESRYNGKGYNEQTLNQFLAELDGFKEDDNVIIIGATNHIEVLDEAAIRGGRFDKKIYISPPNREARESILLVHARNKKLADDVSLAKLARKTEGFSGADLANILNQAVMLSMQNGRNGVISQADLNEAMAIILLGVGKDSKIDQKTRERIAFHEAGHAIVARVVSPENAIYEISIQSRGKAGGYTQIQIPDQMLETKSDLIKRIQHLLGGREAEMLIFKDVSTGASNDLEKASKIARDIILKFGMTGDQAQLVTLMDCQAYNLELEKSRFEAIQEIMLKSKNDTQQILKRYQAALRGLANLLLKKTTLNEEEIEEFFKSVNL